MADDRPRIARFTATPQQPPQSPAPQPGATRQLATANDQGYGADLRPAGRSQTGSCGRQRPQQTTDRRPGAGPARRLVTVAWNEALMKSLPGLRAQAEAARQRLGPVAAASADVAGNFGSPTTALNFVPYVGPELAGGLHEGIKSYNSQPDWIPSSAELDADRQGHGRGRRLGGSSATALARQSQTLSCSNSAQAASVRRLLISSRHGSPVRN